MVSGSADYEYLLSLRAVRERCFRVQEAAVKNKLNHFDIDSSKLQDMVQFVVSLIKRDYQDDPSKIPGHGRWRHFDVGGKPRIQTLIDSWANLGTDNLEQTRRVLDLFVIAILLDIDPRGWVYHEKTTNRNYKRREGIAVAVLDMYMAGVFSIDPNQPHRVDCK